MAQGTKRRESHSEKSLSWTSFIDAPPSFFSQLVTFHFGHVLVSYEVRSLFSWKNGGLCLVIMCCFINVLHCLTAFFVLCSLVSYSWQLRFLLSNPSRTSNESSMDNSRTFDLRIAIWCWPKTTSSLFLGEFLCNKKTLTPIQHMRLPGCLFMVSMTFRSNEGMSRLLRRTAVAM